jgi:hypothetical protein
MANQPEHIESVASVAARLGSFEPKVVALAGERALIYDWDNVPYITWGTAARVAKAVRADVERAAEITRQRAEEHESKLEAEMAEDRRRTAAARGFVLLACSSRPFACVSSVGLAR